MIYQPLISEHIKKNCIFILFTYYNYILFQLLLKAHYTGMASTTNFPWKIVLAEVNKHFVIPSKGDELKTIVSPLDAENTVYTVDAICNMSSEENCVYTVHPSIFATDGTMLNSSHEVRITRHDNGTYSSIAVKYVSPFDRDASNDQYVQEPLVDHRWVVA